MTIREIAAATLILCAGGAHAQTSCLVPGPAGAAGYTTETYGAPLTVGTTPNPSTSYPEISGAVNVVPYTFTGTSWTNIGETNSNGSVTVNGTGQAYGNGLATAEVTPAGQTLQGIAFGGGGYFQVTMSGNGPMSFWMNDAETMNGASNGTGSDSADSWIEADIAEFDTTNAYGFSIHNWYGAIGSGAVVNANENGASPAGANYSQPNNYGMLWVPATATSQGYAKFYFNGQQVGNTITWSQYVPGQSAPDNPFAVMDSLHMVPILGSGSGSTATFSNLQVWQSSNANDIGTGVASAAAAAPCGSGGTATSAVLPTATSAPLQATTPTPAVSLATQDPTPGQGSATDCQGNVWSVNSNNKILQNGEPVVGGGDTSDLIVQGCTVFGLSNGQNGSQAGWFVMGAASPTTTDGWTSSAAPSGVEASATSATPTVAAATPSVVPVVCGNTSPTGAFKVSGGQIIGPDGKPFIARGVNVYDFEAISAADAIIATFPGINFIRIGMHSYSDPSSWDGFVQQMTARGTVLEFEDHPDGGGGQDSGPPGGIGAESAWYASMAAHFASNPYVWFGTFNEPKGISSLSSWQQATYQAIRGAGDNNPILIYSTGELGVLQPGVYATMTNIIWDVHFYGGGGSTDTDPMLAASIASSQSIQSADGLVPALIGEYGDSQDGTNVDSNGEQAVASVINRGSSGQNGSAAWAWDPGGAADHLQSGGVPTDPYGAAVALYINTDVIPCTAAQTAANAQSDLTQITAQAAPAPSTSDAVPDASPGPVTADPTAQGQIDAADAAVAKANATIANVPAVQ